MHFGDRHLMILCDHTMEDSGRKWMLGFQQLLHSIISTCTFTRMKTVQTGTRTNVLNQSRVETGLFQSGNDLILVFTNIQSKHTPLAKTHLDWVQMGLDLMVCCPSVSSYAGPAGFLKFDVCPNSDKQ